MNKTSTSGNLKAIAAAIAILVLLVVGYLLDAPTYLRQALTWVDGLGLWAPVVFVGMYVAVCVLVIPGSILTLGAGAVFGVIRGAIFTSVGATLGATVAFILGRTLMRDWIATKVARSPRLTAVDKAVEREGGKLVFLLRLSPLVPFSISNYVYGLTKIRLWQYVLASFVGMMPGILLYAYIGSLIRRVTELGAGAGGGVVGGTTPAEWALYVLGLIATIVATLRVTAVARRALREHNVDAELEAQTEGEKASGERSEASADATG
ncbi:MAG: TVP38/TMEM64 family protein [Spirochaetia bacterium]